MSNEQSIRDELARDLNLAYDLATGMAVTDEQFIPCADWLLGDSPVIRRIQAEAWFEGADAAVHGYDLPDASNIHNPYIERGEAA